MGLLGSHLDSKPQFLVKFDAFLMLFPVPQGKVDKESCIVIAIPL